MTDHIGELAALYALGALNDRERDAVDTHVARCDACVRLLAQAEDDVTTLAAAEPQRPAPASLDSRMQSLFAQAPQKTEPERTRGHWPIFAIAAMFIVAILPTAYLMSENVATHRAMVADTAAWTRMTTSPHKTVAFTGLAPGADARVMYGPDGSWYFVVVRGSHGPLDVVWTHDGTQTRLGTAEPRGDVAMLYLPKSHKMNQLALMDGDRVVAEAQLVF